MLSPEARRLDKNSVVPDRVPKFYIDDVEGFKARYPGIEVKYFRGRPYVSVWDFESTRWILSERIKYSKHTFGFGVLVFCKFKNSFPDDLIEAYKRNRRLLVEDLRSFIAKMVSEGYSGSYLKTVLSAIIAWLNINDIEISRAELRIKYRVKIPQPVEVGDFPPTRNELRKILLSSPLKYRAIFSFLSATGMRPSEALILRIGDLNPHPFEAVDTGEIVEVRAPITKKGLNYVTFCHPECVEILSDYLKGLEERGVDVEDENQLLFYNPQSRKGFFLLNTVERYWRNRLRILGLDDAIQYGRKIVFKRRLYTLRKFFRTNLEAAGVPYGAIEAMLGHKQWYVRFSVEKLKSYYEKGMWALMVLKQVSEDRVLELIESSIKPLREEIRMLKVEKEKELLDKEREARELVEKLYRLLMRRPELLKELLS